MTKETGDMLEWCPSVLPWWKKIYYWFYRNASDLQFSLFKRLPCFFERGKKGYSSIDTWSFDAYLCGVISGGVKHLRDNLHGAPYQLFDNHAENPTWRWEKILDTIIEGFDAGKALINNDFIEIGDTLEEWEPKEKELRRKFNRGMRLFKKYFFHLWD
jgi:hypothetical protein